MGQGKAAERWVKDFAQKSGISASVHKSLEQVVQLLNERLQLRLNTARLYAPFSPVANDWLARIINKTPLPKHSSVLAKQELTEQLLAELYAFANTTTQTRCLDLWNQTQEIQEVGRQDDVSPKGLWEKYSQQVEAQSPIARQVAVAHIAIQEGWEDKLNDILACDPAIQKIQKEQGIHKARSHIKTIVRAAKIQQIPPEQRQKSLLQQQKKNSRPPL